MKYIEFINQKIKERVLQPERMVLFGQNISAGSCLGGLTRNLKVQEKGFVINTPNSENTLCGIGFGLMLQGVDSVFFMKQQDFLLLGIDHLVNTYNFIRRKKPETSFTIMNIVVDCGYQGLQSSLNNFGDFCSISRVPGFAITNKIDGQEIISSQLISPGFRIIGVSQRLFGQELIEPEKIYSNQENTIFQYAEGKDATIVCFNFSFPYGWELFSQLKSRGKKASLFSVNALTPVSWAEIIENIKETKNLVVIDDSKSENLSCYAFLNDVSDNCKLENKIVITKDMSGDWLSPNADLLDIDYKSIVEKLTK